MFSKLNPAAAMVGTLLMALAVTGVTQVLAQEAPMSDLGGPMYSTTCGAGTITECAKVNKEICDFEFEFSFDPATRNVTLKFGRTDCKPGALIPIYKDRRLDSSFGKSCDLLMPFLGMPAGAGCSED